jgi:serine/threonine protein kinase
LGILGLPRDITFWDPSESVLAHIQSICTTDGLPPPTEPIDFQALFPYCPSDGIDVLKDLLQLNPENRITVEQALNCSFVQPFKDPIEESLVAPICLPHQYDFEYVNDDATLKEMVIHEIESFKRQQEVMEKRHEKISPESAPAGAPRRYHTLAADTESFCTPPTQTLDHLPSATMSLLEHRTPIADTAASTMDGVVYSQDALVREPEELGEDDNYSYLFELIKPTPGVSMTDPNRKFREPATGVARDKLERALTGTC